MEGCAFSRSADSEAVIIQKTTPVSFTNYHSPNVRLEAANVKSETWAGSGTVVPVRPLAGVGVGCCSSWKELPEG